MGKLVVAIICECGNRTEDLVVPKSGEPTKFNLNILYDTSKPNVITNVEFECEQCGKTKQLW